MHLVCTIGLPPACLPAAPRDLKYRTFCFSCPFDRLTIYDGPDNLAEKTGDFIKKGGKLEIVNMYQIQFSWEQHNYLPHFTTKVY